MDGSPNGMSEQADGRRAAFAFQIAATDDLATARRRAVELAAGPLGTARASDVALVTSELVTNALEHGGSPPVDLTVSVHDDAVTIVVASDASAVPALPQRWVPVDEERGRGLQISTVLSDGVDISVVDGRVSVAARFDRP